MYGPEDILPVLYWNERPHMPPEDNTQEGHAMYVPFLQLQRGVPHLLRDSAPLLASSYTSPVQHWAVGRYSTPSPALRATGGGLRACRWRTPRASGSSGAAGGCAGHVLHSLYVADVTGKLCHVAQLSALPGSPGISRLEESESERLVVGVNCELSPFQHPVEVVDTTAACQEILSKDK